MNSLIDILRPDFLLHHAVYGSLVVGFVCPLVGAYFLLRRLVFWGVALPQVSAAGIACALMLQGLGVVPLSGVGRERYLAIVGSIIFTVGAILLLVVMDQRGRGVSEGRVGAIYAVATAAAILFLVSNPAGEVEMLGLLKGEIISISEDDFHLILDLFGLIGVCMLLFQKEFMLVSYDQELAVTLGRNVIGWNIVLYGLVGLAISLGVMTVGPLVIFGFLLIPPMIALPWARGMMSFSLVASAAGGISAVGGFYLSYHRDLPLGPVMVSVAVCLLLLSTALRAIASRV